MIILLMILGTSLGVDGHINASTGIDTCSINSVEQKGSAISLMSTCSENHMYVNVSVHNVHFESLIIDKQLYHTLSIHDEASIIKNGCPELPVIRRSIQIQPHTTYKVKITNIDVDTYTNIDIAPSKGNPTRNQSLETIPYSFHPSIYTQDSWYPENIVNLEEPYIFRDLSGQVLSIYPFQYNPVRSELRLYHNISVEIHPQSDSLNHGEAKGDEKQVVDKEFYDMYRHHFINFDSSLYIPSRSPGSMLVITHEMFWEELQPFITWKMKKGIPITVVNISDIGMHDSDIKEYISKVYQESNLTYVLLVGDAQQIPTHAVTHPSDPSYTYIIGDDHYPDVLLGRFSAETSNQLETQIQRTIHYEKHPSFNAEWLSKGIGIASKEGPGDDNEYDHQHMDNIRTDLLNFTYVHVDQIYHNSGTIDSLRNALHQGRGIINYCGHGHTYGWVTTGFTSDDVTDLTNEQMLPFIISVSCLTGNFAVTTCFAETWLRATHNDIPTGAVAAFMSSKSQGWNPPMDAQDEMIDILIGSYQNRHPTSFGRMTTQGCIHMNDAYGEQGYIETDAWHVFGDPSLQLFTGTPQQCNVSFEDSIMYNATSFDVTVHTHQQALCSLSYNGSLLGSAWTDNNGDAHIEFPHPLHIDMSTLDLTVTGFNMNPFVSEVTVRTPEVDLSIRPVSLFKFKAVLSNTGNVDVKDITFTFICNETDAVGGQQKQGMISWLPVGSRTVISSDVLSGFGVAPIQLTIEVSQGVLCTVEKKIVVWFPLVLSL